MSGVFLVLDCLHWKEERYRRELCHDAGKLLTWELDRSGVPRSCWQHGYCFRGQKKLIPTKKKERQAFLDKSLCRLHAEMVGARSVFGGELQVVGLGSLACECLIGGSRVNQYSGTRWDVLPQWRDLGISKAWIANSPAAALYDPDLIVEISRTLMTALAKTGIEPGPFKGPAELPVPFDWLEYQGPQPRGSG